MKNNAFNQLFFMLNNRDYFSHILEHLRFPIDLMFTWVVN